jgi:hypothetical protein
MVKSTISSFGFTPRYTLGRRGTRGRTGCAGRGTRLGAGGKFEPPLALRLGLWMGRSVDGTAEGAGLSGGMMGGAGLTDGNEGGAGVSFGSAIGAGGILSEARYRFQNCSDSCNSDDSAQAWPSIAAIRSALTTKPGSSCSMSEPPTLMSSKWQNWISRKRIGVLSFCLLEHNNCGGWYCITDYLFIS